MGEPKPPVVPFEPTLEVGGVVALLPMLLGAAVTAEPTLLGAVAVLLPVALCPVVPLAGMFCMLPLLIEPEVAGMFCMLLLFMVPLLAGIACMLLLLGVEPSIAAEATGVEGLALVVLVELAGPPEVPAEPTEPELPKEPELAVEPAEPGLPALEPVLTASEVGVPPALPAEALVSLLPLLQATKPKDNNALAKTTVVFLTMGQISNL